LLNSEQKVEECDATKAHQGTEAGIIIIQLIFKELLK